MSTENSAAKRQYLIEKIVQQVKAKVDEVKAKAMTRFVRYALVNISEEDLKERSVEDLLGTLHSFWDFIEHRAVDERKVRVFNPSVKNDGWESSHTVIQVIQNDMPFLVDSVISLLKQQNINVHLLIHGAMEIERDKKGRLLTITPYRHGHTDCPCEAPMYIEIDRQLDDKKHLAAFEKSLISVLDDVKAVVSDFSPMRQALQSIIAEFEPAAVSANMQEAVAFLKWIASDHFTFLSAGEFKVEHDKKQARFVRVKSRSLGLGRYIAHSESVHYENLTEMLDKEAEVPVVIISKSNSRATVHRGAYKDIVDVLRFDEHGKVIGKSRFVGLFTSVTYYSNPRHIPLLRKKIDYVLKRAGYSPSGHTGKQLINILETFPRDELFQISRRELYQTVMGILQLQERQRVRLFVRKDTYGQYYTCMVYVPQDRYNTELRIKIQNLLMREFKAKESAFKPNFLEGSMCRIDYVFRVDPDHPVEIDKARIENKVVVAARDWSDDLRASLAASFDEYEAHQLFGRYQHAFSAGYCESFIARSAVSDIEHLEYVRETGKLGMRFYCLLEEPKGHIHFKLFQKGRGINLTECLPIFENLGLTVLEERPYEVSLDDDNSIWISDFGMCVKNSKIDPHDVSEVFKLAFRHVWNGVVENDGFNRLVMMAGMDDRKIVILRTVAKYLMQTGIHYSQQYMEEALGEYPAIASALVSLFDARFNPEHGKDRAALMSKEEANIRKLLGRVVNLDKDRMLRRFMCVIMAMLRTNYYQLDAEGEPKAHISIKLDPERISDMPKPLPKYEIFVYSPRVEGVHLRCGKVARGGLRWSDRREDFRTEVLGLMKAQQVKNSVIVPVGAKGGFVPKHLPDASDREAWLAEGVSCYKTFICALLDVTDNYVDGKLVHPDQVVRYDGDDPYLVVAADKGTATFSDIANGVAEEYGFWLGDAFASGGSNGYDHKKMGITARGAWESVKRHFLQMDVNIQKTDFSVVGIGDMSGDVFGNGMLLSKHICLKAAFNHLHIFIDPNPDSATSYKERERLFKLPRSSWSDYDAKLISKGGGIFERSAKSIPLSPEIQAFLGLSDKTMEPNRLIQLLLTSKVDLLWNGGIGTYVKASTEGHLDVGDRANDPVRVDAIDLQAKVIGEGGNLGFTQLARVEFALHGGKVWTDAVDNSAGVDCSDHEVNIKILLNDAVQAKVLDAKKRNALLATMDKSVAKLVLKNNYEQTQVLTAMFEQSVETQEVYIRLMHELEREAGLDREVEFLPTDKQLRTRFTNNQGLASSELCVLMAYSKSVVKQTLTTSNLWQERYFQDKYLQAEFPEVLREKFADLMPKHQLAKDIIMTQFTNTLMHRMGMTFMHRLYDETGASCDVTARAFSVNLEVFELESLWADISALDGKVNAHIQSEMMTDIARAIRRLTRWLLRSDRGVIDVMETVERLGPKVKVVLDLMPDMLCAEDLARKNARYQYYKDAGVPDELAMRLSNFAVMFSIYDIIEGASFHQVDLVESAEIYFALDDALHFGWMRDAINSMQVRGYWDTLSISALRDDLDKLQRFIAMALIQTTDSELDVATRIATWSDMHTFLVNRWHYMVEDIKTSQAAFVRYSVALRCLLDLAQVALHDVKARRGEGGV